AGAASGSRRGARAPPTRARRASRPRAALRCGRAARRRCRVARGRAARARARPRPRSARARARPTARATRCSIPPRRRPLRASRRFCALPAVRERSQARGGAPRQKLFQPVAVELLVEVRALHAELLGRALDVAVVRAELAAEEQCLALVLELLEGRRVER